MHILCRINILSKKHFSGNICQRAQSACINIATQGMFIDARWVLNRTVQVKIPSDKGCQEGSMWELCWSYAVFKEHKWHSTNCVPMLQEGRPLPGPETVLLSNTQKWISRGDTCADKAREFIGKGRPGREQGGKGTQKNCSTMRLAVLSFTILWSPDGKS